MIWEQLDSHLQKKIKVIPCLTLYIRINSKWNRDINVKK